MDKGKLDKEHGEGNYKASREYNDKTEAFVENNAATIPAKGREAADALAGAEGEALRKAEKLAKDKARR